MTASDSLSLPKSRLGGIDAFRVIAFAAVALLHCVGQNEAVATTGTMIDHAMRFAVPFFFICSGYFQGQKDAPTIPALTKFFQRLFPVFLFWMVFYLCYEGNTEKWTDPGYIVHCLISGGPGFHLWFLPALGMSVAGVLFLRKGGWPMLLGVGIGLYALGLLYGPYREWLGLPDVGIRTRNGPFFGLFFVAAGYLIARHKISFATREAVLMIIVGLTMQVFEALMISHSGYGLFTPHDFLAGTAIFGLGVFFLAQSMNNAKSLQDIAPLGKAALAMYCIHVLFIKIFSHVLDKTDLLQALSMAGLVIACSVLSSVIMIRIPGLKRVTA